MKRIAVGLMAILLCLTKFSNAQSTWPKTLLWRISGNGLKGNSYLYGTMHLQDKRLFQFGDSLYHSLESTEGFALEVDLRDFMDSMFTHEFNRVNEKFYQPEVRVDAKNIDKAVDSAMKELGLRKDRLTRKELKKIRDYRMNKFIQQGEMPTFVDAYLYGMAVRQGKWIGGVEDVNDQMYLLDEVGADMSPEEALAPDKIIRQSLEQMIQVYLQQDLSALEQLTAGNGSNWKNKVLTQRNVKMARRMDSLSRMKTMFFAVGAAHLPGDSGVITLLRRQGFQVDPVFSSQRIAGEEYSRKLNAVPWIKLADSAQGYSVEMPGKASSYLVLGEAVKMNVFFDITTMTMYMAGQTIGNLYSAADADRIFASMAQNMKVNPKTVKKKELTLEGRRGYEALFSSPSGMFRVQIQQKDRSMYLMMVGSAKKDRVSSTDAAKFFSSLHIDEAPRTASSWQSFTLPSKNFSVSLPTIPKSNKAMDKAAEHSNWNFETYDLADNRSGLYYLVQIRDMKPAFYLNDDSSYFESFRDDLASRFKKVQKAERRTYAGLPAYYFEGIMEKENVEFHVLHIVDGSRVYSLNVGGSPASDFRAAETLFNSFQLLPTKPLTFTTHSGFGFITSAPSGFTDFPFDSTDVPNVKSAYVSFDSVHLITYNVLAKKLDPYYWTDSDSSFFADQISTYMNEEDSVIWTKETMMGKIKAKDYFLKPHNSFSAKRMRVFGNGDSAYVLLAMIPYHRLQAIDYEPFFRDFKMQNVKPAEYKMHKTAAILRDLHSTDSATFFSAYNSMDNEFDHTDLAALKQAFGDIYKADSDEPLVFVNDAIGASIRDISDTAAVAWFRKQYLSLKGEKEILGYTILELLSSIHTRESYLTLKELIMGKLPSKGDAAGMGYKFYDSLALTSLLFPEVLKYAGDSTFNSALVYIIPQLIDSGYLKPQVLKPYEAAFHERAKAIVALEETEDDYYTWQNQLNVLRAFHDAESMKLARQYYKTYQNGLKETILLMQLEAGETPDAAALASVSSSIGWRIELYDTLVGLHKEAIFPAKYATVRMLGESAVFNAGTEDDWQPESVTFVAEKKEIVRGQLQTLLLYKVSYQTEDGEENYLGVAQLPAQGKKGIRAMPLTGIYWGEAYDKSKLPQQLKAYLTQIQDAEAEK